jgi:hypothetical protein
MGSTVAGGCDFYSDLDMALYHEALPSEEERAERRASLGAEEFRALAEAPGEAVIEDFRVDGIECQLAHVTVAAWERDMAVVLEGLDVTSPLQKALSGTLEGEALHGADVIDRWKARARDYPEALAEALVRHYLQAIPAVWALEKRLTVRDAELWLREMVVDAEYGILGVLAGLNRVYYTTFQFKRLWEFAGQLKVAPEGLAVRLDQALTAPSMEAIGIIRGLVEETVSLVEAGMESVDTAGIRKRLAVVERAWG